MREQLSRKGPGSAGYNKLSTIQHYALLANRATHILICNMHSIASWSKGDPLAIRVMVWPHLGYCAQLWTPQFKKGAEVLESIHGKAPELIKGL